MTNNFDRLGRSTNIIDGAGSRFLAYNATGQLLGETNSSGTLLGANLRFGYDQYQRRTSHEVFATNTSLLVHSFAFDGASRITNVSDGTYQAGYSRLANSPLISQITYRSNSTTRMTIAKSYDYLNRLQNITSTPSASGESPIAFDYAYNDANQRTRVNMADGSFWIYEYDKLGQVVSGKRYWNDWTPVAGQQYEYAFDDIGNRSSTKAGGDQAGAALRAASYTANALNQYTSRDVPAYLNVLGIAHANASVTVNSQSPYRRGDYFRQELSADNSSAALWQPVTNIASLSGTSHTNTGNLFLPKPAETYTYDLDGNLTSDGRWTNQWDGENRLIDMTSHASGPSDSRKSLQFAYDSQGRRYSKVVSNWTGSAWTRALHEKFVYDGWNLLGALDGTNNAIIRSFLWGLDLSGSLQGAGGVGGLICFKQYSGSQAGAHFAAYDGNGNVMALVDGSTGVTSARYEYDPFGQTIRASGAMAMLNPVRFSSKHVDDETELAYYGYRYLNPNSGRWLSRDPIEEQGGINLTTFVLNRPTSLRDSVGLSFDWDTPTYTTVPRPIPDPDDPDNKIGGGTDWSYFSPSVTVWTHSSVCPCPQYTLSVFGHARVFYWWVKGVERYRQHELLHVEQHFYPAFASFKESAESYQGQCMPKKRADCLKGVIEGEMRAAYMQQAYATGTEYDCNDYGGGDPTSDACQRRDQQVQLYLSNLAALSTALQKCEED